MKLAGSFVLAAVLVVSQNAWGQDLISSSAGSLDAIRSAPTASDATNAYAKAIANVRDPSAAQKAFIQKMIDLESPELGEAQAKELTQFVGDGTAWAVMAFASGQRGEIAPAMDQTAKAVKYAPDNAFVQKTAAQLLAWYDYKVDADSVSDSTKQTAETIRKNVEPRRGYAQTYREVTELLEQAETPPAMASNGGVILGNSTLSQLMYGVNVAAGSVPELALFWDSPYLNPGYSYYPGAYGYGGYGYNPWFNAGRFATGYAFPQVWVRNVDRNTRYVRLPGNNGFILDGGWGTAIVPTGGGYYPPNYFYGGYSNYYYGGGLPGHGPVGGIARQPYWNSGWGYNQLGVGVGTTRLSQRMRGGIAPVVDTWRYQPAPYRATAPYRSPTTPGRPVVRPRLR